MELVEALEEAVAGRMVSCRNGVFLRCWLELLRVIMYRSLQSTSKVCAVGYSAIQCSIQVIFRDLLLCVMVSVW